MEDDEEVEDDEEMEDDDEDGSYDYDDNLIFIFTFLNCRKVLFILLTSSKCILTYLLTLCFFIFLF